MKSRPILVLSTVSILASLAIAQAKTGSPAKSAAHAAAPTTQFDRNLIKNGNAETEGPDEKHVPDWPVLEGFTGVKYGSVSGEWDWGLSGCASCGKRYLHLAFEGSTHELSVSQAVDVSASAQDIDKADVASSLSAYLGAFLNSDSTSIVQASFLDSSGKELAKIETQPYSTKDLPKAERGSTGLVECKTSGQVPAGTRKIVITWKATATGDSGDYLALGDNLSLVLTKPKDPQQ